MEIDTTTVCDGSAEVHAFQCFIHIAHNDFSAYVTPVSFLPGLKGLYRRRDDTFSSVQNWERYFTTEVEARQCAAAEMREFAANVARAADRFEAGEKV